jgi:hypothetical protein
MNIVIGMSFKPTPSALLRLFEANVNNANIDDAMFRDLIRNSLGNVDYGEQDHQHDDDVIDTSGVTPLTPSVASQLKDTTIPDDILEAVNSFLVSKSKSITIRQNKLMAKIASIRGVDNTDMFRNEIYNNHDLDFEDIYRANGWKVKYDQPCRGESFEAYFNFTKK